jgi:hypothetical protein
MPVTVDGAGVTQYLERARQDVRVVGVRALNRTITTVRTRGDRALARATGLTQERVKRSTAVVPATVTSLRAGYVVGGKPIPLGLLGARGPEPSRGRGRGVTYRTIPRGGRTLAEGAFLATVRSPRGRPHRGVFRRVTRGPGSRPGRRGRPVQYRTRRKPIGSWLPIEQLYGPSLPQVAASLRLEQIAEEAQRTVLPKNLEHELAFIQRRLGKA